MTIVNLMCLLSQVFVVHAALVSAPDLRVLVDQSDRVIVASILSINDIENTDRINPKTNRTAELSVVRSLAGSLGVGDRISVSWTEVGLGKVKSGLIGEHGLWFLKQESARQFTPLPFASGSRSINDLRIGVAPLLTFLPERSNLSTTERALQEILNTAESSTESAYKSSYLHHGAYDELSPSILRQFYARLAESDLDWKSSRGLAGLVRMGDVLALRRIEANLSAMAPYLELIGYSISSRYRNIDPVGLAILHRFSISSQSPNFFQLSAAQALAFIHTSACVPYLEVLLNSGEPQRELLGAAGLALFANGVKPISVGGSGSFIPSNVRGPFASDETMQNFTLDATRFTQKRSELLNFWKAWLQTNRDQILKTP